jgi:hypothetical protein
MILAVKRAQPGDPQQVLAQIAGIKQFYGIQEQCLESLLEGGEAVCDTGSCETSPED